MIFIFDNKIFPKDDFTSEPHTIHTDVLEKTGHLSDDELYQLAKNVDDDALPGESDYSQILLTEAIRLNPKNVNALLEAARMTEMQPFDAVTKAQKKFGFIYQAFLIEPNNPKVRYKFASVLLELDQKYFFQKIYSQTLNEFPDHVETQLQKIQILSKTNPKLALELSDEALKNGADINDFLEYFLIALEKSDAKKNFSKNLLEYAEKYQSRALWYNLGLQYIIEKQYDKASDAFQKSIEFGNKIAGRLQLGILQYRYQNKINDGIVTLQTLLGTLKDNLFISKNFVYLVHIHLTCALMLSRNTEATAKELNFVAKYAYQNHLYFINMANEFIKNGRDDILKQPMEIAIQNDPLFAEPYYILSNILKKQKKDSLSHEVYQKFLVIDSQKK